MGWAKYPGLTCCRTGEFSLCHSVWLHAHLLQCPHDGACPLYIPGVTKLVCSFSQRLQRPAFVRKTKHSGVGHEDSGYSYVVIRRGARPAQQGTKVGRLGYVGKVEAAKAALKEEPLKELIVEDDHHGAATDLDHPLSSEAADEISPGALELADKDLEAALRLEAYSWPRLVFPPLKKSGHIILDSCTAEGTLPLRWDILDGMHLIPMSR